MRYDDHSLLCSLASIELVNPNKKIKGNSSVLRIAMKECVARSKVSVKEAINEASESDKEGDQDIFFDPK
jgi:hypothetical protein